MATVSNTSAQHKHSVNVLQTFHELRGVCGIVMRATEDLTAVIFIIGLGSGEVVIFRTPLDGTSPICFDLVKKWRPHKQDVNAVHMHFTKPLFVSASSDKSAQIWSVREVTAPVLVKLIVHPDSIYCAKYSYSGLLLTGCDDHVVRVFGVEPVCELLWSCKCAGDIYSVAWSPSNYIAVAFDDREHDTWVVAVWDSTFHSLFQYKQDRVRLGNQGLSFVSDVLLLCAGSRSKNLCAYNVPECKVTAYRYPNSVRSVMMLSSEIVCVSCGDDKLRVCKVNGTELRLLVTLPFKQSTCMASCVYPFNGGGYVIASACRFIQISTRISLASKFNRYCVQEVEKLMYHSMVLPFCRDVHKIILQYL